MCPPKPLRMWGGGVLIPVSGSPIEWTRSVGLACRASMSNLRRACAELKSHRLLAALCRVCGSPHCGCGRRDRIAKLRATPAVENQKPALDTASTALSYKPLRGFGVPYSPRRPPDQQDHHRHRRISFPSFLPLGRKCSSAPLPTLQGFLSIEIRSSHHGNSFARVPIHALPSTVA